MGFAAHLFGPTRAYMGTDTRAWELLLGGALAMIWPCGRETRETPGTREGTRIWSVMTVIGSAVLVAGMWAAKGPPEWVWNGGLEAIALGAGMLVVGSVRAQTGGVARFLTVPPMRWLGLISYSLYLWHWPAIVLITPDNSGLTGIGLLIVRLVVMLTASVLSYYLVESPLRRLDWSRLGQRMRMPVPSFASAGVVATAVLIVAATIGPATAPSAAVELSSPAGATDAVRLDVTPASSGHPYRVWIVGDSVMADASPGVTAALQATGDVSVVADSSAGGWGLTTDPGFPSDASKIVTRDHPQIVMGTWTWDDTEALKDPGAYLQRLETAMRRLLTPGSGVELVALIQFPQFGRDTEWANRPETPASWTLRVQAQNAWDNAAREAVKAFPGRALYLSTDLVFAPGGRFYAWMRSADGRWLRVRKLDNAHFCPYGSAELGALLVDELTPDLHLEAPAPGWELGPWSHLPRYNDPPGACPNDQPPPGFHGSPLPSGQSHPGLAAGASRVKGSA
jgi:hypothetical protein